MVNAYIDNEPFSVVLTDGQSFTFDRTARAYLIIAFAEGRQDITINGETMTVAHDNRIGYNIAETGSEEMVFEGGDTITAQLQGEGILISGFYTDPAP